MTAALHTFYLGLGGNLGDRAAMLTRAVERLTAAATQWRRADWYAAAPVDYTAQPWFLNTVLEVTVRLTPAEMLARGLALEAEFGRVRTTPKGARPLDVDILLCRTAAGAFLVSDDPTLTLPHPRLHLRRFALTPLCDLIPDARHPRLGRTFAALLAECPDDGPVYRLGETGFNFADDGPATA